jgi:transposase-like protein
MRPSSRSRLAIYTTNLIDSLNGAFRKFTSYSEQYPNRDSALKVIYLAVNEAWKRWTKVIHNWKEALNRIAFMFEDRMPKA